MYLECRLRCQMVSAHGVWVKHQSAVPVLTQHTYWVTTTISRRTGTVINHILDINYCIAVLNKTVSQLIVKFHVQLVNHIVWLFYGRKFPFTLNIVDLPSSLLSIKTTNRLLGSKRHFGVSKWMLVVLDQYNRLGGWELLSQPDGLMIVLMKKKQKKDLLLIHWFHRQAYSFIRGRQCTAVASNCSTIWSHVTINLNFGQRMLNTFLSESDHQDSLSNWQITIPPHPRFVSSELKLPTTHCWGS